MKNIQLAAHNAENRQAGLTGNSRNLASGISNDVLGDNEMLVCSQGSHRSNLRAWLTGQLRLEILKIVFNKVL